MTTNSGMSSLIQVVNKLQDSFAASGLPFGLELPQIAVIGGQSAGKSSVLENFVGKDFLPRGSGIVTRVPLILQLKYSPKEEYAEFKHKPGKKYTNFDEVTKEIEDETDRLTQGEKGVSANPINLRVYSPNVLDLTLVDLPGMTRVPVADQPEDIEQQIRNLVLEYVRQDNCLILAVSPANADLANSDALRVAREVDPDGNRTVGVITKLDLMDAGTDAKGILENSVIPLRRGYIGVVNRSQEDINGKKDIRAAMTAEREFFITNVAYKHIADRMGTPYLQKALNRELSAHIKAKLPSIRSKLKQQMVSIKQQLGDFGTGFDPAWKNKVMMSLIQDFVEDLQRDVQGIGLIMKTDEMKHGARINALFYREFARELSLNKIPSYIIRKEILLAIQNAHAVRNGLFTPDKVFNTVVVVMIQRFRDPINACIERVVALMGDAITKYSAKMGAYPTLKQEIEMLTTDNIQKNEENCKMALKEHIEAECAFLNTRHEDFIGKPSEWGDNVNIDKDDDDEGEKAVPSTPPPTQKLQNPARVPLHKGWMMVQKGTLRGGVKEYWFVLTRETISWYGSEDELDIVGDINLSDGKTRVSMFPPTTKKDPKCVLHRTDGRNVYEHKREITMVFKDRDNMSRWRTFFTAAGLIREEKEDMISEPEPELDENMSREVSIIKTMLESYMTVVSKTIRDIVPKYVVHHLVNRTISYIARDMVTYMSSRDDQDALMECASEEAFRQEELRRAYQAATEALKIIADANLD